MPRKKSRHLEQTQDNSDEHNDDHAHDTIQLDVTVFLFLCMFMGQILKQFSEKTGFPYTSLITVLGIFLGIYSQSLGRIGKAIEVWANFDPHLLLLVFLPALIFESAFNSDWHIFKVEFY